MASVMIKRTALFVAFLLVRVLVAAAVAHASTRERDPDIVAFSGYRPGTIVVKTSERRLYYVLDRRRALRFPVGVRRKGKTWTGHARVEGKFVKPSWSPPDDIRRDQPDLPDVIAGGAANNPMGAAALTMRGGDYAIHGTNRPESIGGFVSYGCIRMHNHDIRTLYSMVGIGTPVIIQR